MTSSVYDMTSSFKPYMQSTSGKDLDQVTYRYIYYNFADVWQQQSANQLLRWSGYIYTFLLRIKLYEGGSWSGINRNYFRSGSVTIASTASPATTEVRVCWTAPFPLFSATTMGHRTRNNGGRFIGAINIIHWRYYQRHCRQVWYI